MEDLDRNKSLEAILMKNGLSNARNTDYSALSEGQHKKLKEYTTKMDHDDSKYLLEHPEIQAICNLIIRNIEKAKPEQLLECCATYFGQSLQILMHDVDNEMGIYPSEPNVTA